MSGGFYGSGNLYCERFVNGVSTGVRSWDNVSKFEIEESADKVDRIGNGLGASNGSSLSTIFNKKPSVLSIVSDNFNLDNVAIQMLGDIKDAAVASSAVVDEVHTIPATRIIDVAGANLQAVVVVKDAADAVIASELQSASLGYVKVIGGNVGDSVKVTYDSLAFNRSVVSGSQHSSIELAFKLDGVNRDGGGKVIVEIPRVIMTPSSPTDFMGQKFAEVSLTGTVVKLEGQDPYSVTFF